MKKTMIIFAIITHIAAADSCDQYPQKMLVNSVVTDLRFEPVAHDPALTLPTFDYTNPLQITQLLLGEYIIAHEEFVDEYDTAWLYVSTLQQSRFLTSQGWHGYQGWLLKQDVIPVAEFPQNNVVVSKQLAPIVDNSGSLLHTLSIGTRLQAIDCENTTLKIILPDQTEAYIHQSDVYAIQPVVDETIAQLRSNIIATSKQFMGYLYAWGGRSAQNVDFALSSVDCSALLHLSFLAHGLQIPRMSREQFLHMSEIEHGSQLQPGDFIFFASVKKHPFLIDHVLMFIEDENILEMTSADTAIARIMPFEQRMQESRHNLSAGDIITTQDGDEYNIYFGTLFTTPEDIQQLRSNALKTDYPTSVANYENELTYYNRFKKRPC